MSVQLIQIDTCDSKVVYHEHCKLDPKSGENFSIMILSEIEQQNIEISYNRKLIHQNSFPRIISIDEDEIDSNKYVVLFPNLQNCSNFIELVNASKAQRRLVINRSINDEAFKTSYLVPIAEGSLIDLPLQERLKPILYEFIEYYREVAVGVTETCIAPIISTDEIDYDFDPPTEIADQDTSTTTSHSIPQDIDDEIFETETAVVESFQPRRSLRLKNIKNQSGENDEEKRKCNSAHEIDYDFDPIDIPDQDSSTTTPHSIPQAIDDEIFGTETVVDESFQPRRSLRLINHKYQTCENDKEKRKCKKSTRQPITKSRERDEPVVPIPAEDLEKMKSNGMFLELSSKLEPTILNIKDKAGKKRQYRMTNRSKNGRKFYFRCSRCDTLAKKCVNAVRARLIICNGEVMGNAFPTHDENCEPLTEEQVLVQQIDRSARKNVKVGFLRPFEAYQDALTRISNVVANNNENSKIVELPKLPEWDKLRRQYNRIKRKAGYVGEEEEEEMVPEDVVMDESAEIVYEKQQ